ncbi:MAG: flippase [Kiritimatiellia bacterium]
MIGRKAILAFSAQFFKNAIGYAAIFFMVRRLSPEAFGTFCFGFAYVGLFSFIADMGLGFAHIKKLSEGRDYRTCVATFLLLRFLLSIAMVAVVLCGLLIRRLVFQKSLASPEHEWVIYLAAATHVVLSLVDVAIYTFAARQETARQVIPDLIAKTIESVLKIAVVVAGLGVVVLAGASLAGAVVAFLLYLLLFRENPVGRPTWAMCKEYLLFALPLVVIMCAYGVTNNLDQILIQFFWNSEELGFYAGAAKITGILTFAGVAVGNLVFPAVSAFHAGGDLESIRKVTHRAERFLSLMLIPAGALMLFFNKIAVRLLLGGQFERSHLLVVILTFSSIATVLSAPYGAQLIGTNHSRLYGLLGVMSVLLSVIFNLILIPSEIGGLRLLGWGARGAAMASVSTAVIMALLYRVVARRVTDTRVNPSVVRHLLAAAIMIAGMYGTTRLFGESGIGALAVVGAVGMFLFFVVLLLLGDPLRDDLDYLRRACSPLQMGTYIAREVRPAGIGPEPSAGEP